MITITSLHTYPVKGLRGIHTDSATVMARGFEFDREWMVVDRNNRFITQRNANLMATIDTTISDTHLVLEHVSAPPLRVSLDVPQTDPESVTVWRDSCEAVDQGEEAAAWLTRILGPNDTGPVRLMRFATDAVRRVEPGFLGDVSAEVGFADGYPFLVTNEATLETLNAHLNTPVPMSRFRPNIVIRGLPALDEHNLATLSVPDRKVTLLMPKPCQRCKVTTIDQQSGEVAESREPLKTLVHKYSLPDFIGGYFGQNGVAIAGLGTQLTVGDSVEVSYK